VTHPATNAILGGITRDRVICLARATGITVEERPFTLTEAKAAREAFMTSTTTGVLPIVRIDDSAVANGKPGSIALTLLDHYRTFSATGMMPK
jgi:D-alanine transaminase